MSKKSSLTLPRQFDKFELVRELGRGATGTVYLAFQSNLKREVAIKILMPDFSQDEDFVTRFQREGSIAASLHHHNIVQLIDASVFEDQYYITMEYVAGPNLREILKQKERLDWRKSVNIACQVLNALDHAHSKGIIHRDVKPANILLGENDRAVLTDFSVAHMKAASRLTTTGALLGTPEYMAPEQFEGAAVDTRSDIYAIGIILYELVTGLNPFRAKTIPEVLKLQLFTIPKSPEILNPDIPLELAQTIKGILCKDPRERPSSAKEVAKRLARAAQAADDVEVGPPTHKIKLGSLTEVERPIPSVAAPPPPPPKPAEPVVVEKKPPPVKPKGRTISTFWGLVMLALTLAGVAAVAQMQQPVAVPTPTTVSLILSTTPENVTLVVDGAPAQTYRHGELLPLRPGKHEVKASAPGYRALEHPFVVSPELPPRLELKLSRLVGNVKLKKLSPEVSLSVDGKESKASDPLELLPGKHRFKFSRPHFEAQTKDVDVLDAKTVEVEEPILKALPSMLVVVTEPAKAHVLIDENDKGTSPLNITLAPGKHQIKVRKEGYEGDSASVELEPEKQVTKQFKLTKIPPKPQPVEPPPPVYHQPRPYVPRPAPPPVHSGGGKIDRI